MSTRSLESSSSSKDLSVDCLEVCLDAVFRSQQLTDRQNYEIGEQLEGGASPEVFLATCKRGRLKRRTVVLKKVQYLANLCFSHHQHNVAPPSDYRN